MPLDLAKSSLNHIPALFKKIPWEEGQVNLDLGGGRFEKTTNYLHKRGVWNIIVDKYSKTKRFHFMETSYMEL